MLEQLRSKSAATAALAREKAEALRDATQKGSALALERAGSLKEATQKSSAALQEKARSAAGSLNIKVPTVVSGSLSSGEASTASETDLECGEPSGGKSPSSTPKNQEQEGLLQGLGQECGLTKRQRLYGALGCYVFGALCGFLSTLMMWGGPRHLKQFAFFYTVGNLCSIGSSLFLVGPLRQLKVMCMPVRRVACCIWMGAMTLTLVVAFGFPRAGPLVMLLVGVQYAAMLWYGASFIPYGRAILRKCCSRAASQVADV